MVIKQKTSKIADKKPVYYVTFEEYLKPKSAHKNAIQLSWNKNLKPPELRLKLLEHPVLIAGHKSKWSKFKANIYKYFTTPKRPSKPQETPNKYDNIRKVATLWQNKKSKESSACNIDNIKLPCFLEFLKARNDDGLCKRKSGFEIYCEMASFHGFINFVGATTWQRAFWCLVVFLAITMSALICLISLLKNSNTPTIIYMESTQHPAWSIPFPAVTICNMNRISKRKATSLAERFHKTTNLSDDQLIHLFRLALFTTEDIQAAPEEYHLLNEVLKKNNYTLSKLLKHLTPNCAAELLRCKWKGRFKSCTNLFQKVPTSFGECCSFNYYALERNIGRGSEKILEYTTSCSYKTGLTVFLDPELDDYKASITQTAGFQVLIHDAYDFADTTALKSIITPTSFNKISIISHQIHATNYISSEALKARRCYLPQERQLFYFRTYSQKNCLEECRSALLYEKCQCTLPNWAKRENWTICGLADHSCIVKNKDIFTSSVKLSASNYRVNNYADQFMCDCYPLCDSNMYDISMDSGKLDRRFSLTDKRFFNNINITSHILLHVFYEELYGERLRLDVCQNWLSFIGTFGGISGLYMGYSFVSAFEMIFFAFVRPACNWLTKKQIQHSVKRRQKKQQMEKENQNKLQMEGEKQQSI